jgi:enterochelin esterase-like enzyme
MRYRSIFSSIVLSALVYLSPNVFCGIQDVTYHSAANKRDVKIKVWTPPGYETGNTRYPVVYNMHGAGGGDPTRQWGRTKSTIEATIGKGLVRPMIYVYVDSVGTWFDDSSKGKGETTFIKELIPFIDAKYRTIATKQGRAVDGFSMGGAGCLYNAFKNPHMFSAVVSYGAALVKGGKESPSYWLDQNVEEIRKSLRVRMVCGSQDGLKKGNDTLRSKLQQLKVPVDYVIVNGVGHDTQGLYERVGLQSLKFIEAAFNGTPGTPNPDPEPTKPEPEPKGFTISLLKGWNLISTPVPTGSTSIDTLIPATSKIDAVYSYAPSSGSYLAYLPGETGNTLTRLDVGKGYWVYAREATMLSIDGTFATRATPLEAGWNMAGYASTTSHAITDAVKSISGKYEAIYMFEAEGQEYLSHTPGGESQFNEFIPGHGYWIYMNSSGSWTLP